MTCSVKDQELSVGSAGRGEGDLRVAPLGPQVSSWTVMRPPVLAGLVLDPLFCGWGVSVG